MSDDARFPKNGAARAAAAGPSTRSVHLAETVDPTTGSVTAPIVANAAFACPDRDAVGIEDVDDLIANLAQALAATT